MAFAPRFDARFPALGPEFARRDAAVPVADLPGLAIVVGGALDAPLLAADRLAAQPRLAIACGGALLAEAAGRAVGPPAVDVGLEGVALPVLTEVAAGVLGAPAGLEALGANRYRMYASLSGSGGGGNSLIPLATLKEQPAWH